MKFSIKAFFSKCDQIHRKRRIWSHLLKKSLMKNFIFCAVQNILLRLAKFQFFKRLTFKLNYYYLIQANNLMMHSYFLIYPLHVLQSISITS